MDRIIFEHSDLLKKYLYSWGIKEKETEDFLKKKISPPFSVSKLDNYILGKTDFLYKDVFLEKENLLGFIQFIYLQEKLYEQFNIFYPLSSIEQKLFSQKMKENQKIFNFPFKTPCKMPSQEITVYNPLSPLISIFKRVINYVFKR